MTQEIVSALQTIEHTNESAILPDDQAEFSALREQLRSFMGDREYPSLSANEMRKINSLVRKILELIKKKQTVEDRPWTRDEVVAWAKEQLDFPEDLIDDRFTFINGKIEIETGELFFEANPKLKFFPNELKILPRVDETRSIIHSAALDCSRCENLIRLPKNMDTLKWLYCNYCPKLQALPAGLDAVERVCCYGCPNLRILPPDFARNGNVVVTIDHHAHPDLMTRLTELENEGKVTIYYIEDIDKKRFPGAGIVRRRSRRKP